LNKYIGEISGIKLFEDNNIPIGKIFPSGKKDGNKLGKRKKNLKHSGTIVCNNYSIIVHPKKVKNILNIYGVENE